MRWLLSSFIVALFTLTSFAEVLDLGDLGQYDPQTDVIPEGLHLDSIYIVEEGDGFKILLGKDVKAKVDAALTGCGEIGNHCYQTVNNILKDAHLQTNQDLETRQLVVAAATLARIWGNVRKLGQAISALIIAMSAAGGQQMYSEKGSFWSESAASNAANLPEATPITISADGSVIATVTQSPEKTTLEGSVIPVVTVVESASEGFEKGDLSGVLDVSLANRLDEFMHRRKDCQAGRVFDEKHSKRRRASGSYGQALCAAQSVMQGATADGPFNDLVLLSPAGVHFQFVKAAGAAREAANELAEFVTAYAPLIALPEDLVEEISVYVFALAIDTIVENIPLGEQNRIKATMVTTTDSPSSTSTGCPEPHSIICGVKDAEDCALKIIGDGKNKKAVCEKGEYKDCKCNPPPRTFTNMASKEQQEFLISVNDLLKNHEPAKEADCPDKSTPIPASLFDSDSMNVQEHFCDEWTKDKDRSMTINSKGEDVNPEPHLRGRAPKVDADTYDDWLFDLSFDPTKGDKKCSRDCNSAFDHMSGVCATPPGKQILPGIAAPGAHMYEKGSLDVGCGTFSYSIHKRELTELKEFKQFCYKKDDFAPLKGDGVDKLWVGTGTADVCRGKGRRPPMIKKGDKNTFVHQNGKINKVPYQYNIWWKDGCTLADDGPSEVYITNPLVKQDYDSEGCQKYLYRNWRNCNNGGVGGNIQVGCLIYEFKADENERTW